jgi:hypothetical protein
VGTNLLGRGALVDLDAGLCELAVSLKSAGRSVPESKFGRCVRRSHSPYVLASWVVTKGKMDWNTKRNRIGVPVWRAARWFGEG